MALVHLVHPPVALCSRLASLCLAFCCLAGSFEAKKAGGSLLLTGNSTVFLDKFCFNYNENASVHNGYLNVTLWAPKVRGPVAATLLLLDDEPDSFAGPSQQWDALSCEEKASHAKTHDRLDWRKLSRDKGQTMRFAIGQRSHPRFWYLALADCSGDDFHLRWKANFTNMDFGFAQELSAERRFSPLVFLVLTLTYGGLVCAQRYVNRCLSRHGSTDSASEKAAHPFARLLLLGLGCAFCESLLSTLHLVSYAVNGVGAPLADKIAQVGAVSSNFVLVSLLLLISEGKCISYIMVKADVRSKFKLLAPFLIACFLLEFRGEYAVSQTYATDYVYTTPCGIVLILVDLYLLGVYLCNLRHTYGESFDRSESEFYITWGLVYAAWFLALPFTALLAQAVVAPWAWYLACMLVKKGFTVLMYFSLVVGLWPGNVQSYFQVWDMVDLHSDLPVLLSRSVGALAKQVDPSRQPFRKYVMEP